MKTLNKHFPIVVGVCVGVMVANAETAYFRDSSRRLAGSMTTGGNGKTVYKDGQGRIQRTVTTNKNGKTTFCGYLGRTQGIVQTDALGKTTWRDAVGRVQVSSSTDLYGKTSYRHGSDRTIGTRTVRQRIKKLRKSRWCSFCVGEGPELIDAYKLIQLRGESAATDPGRVGDVANLDSALSKQREGMPRTSWGVSGAVGVRAQNGAPLPCQAARALRVR